MSAINPNDLSRSELTAWFQSRPIRKPMEGERGWIYDGVKGEPGGYWNIYTFTSGQWVMRNWTHHPEKVNARLVK